MFYAFLCFALAFLGKLGSILVYKISLDKFISFEDNLTYIINGMIISLGPSCLMAPLFAYDNKNCVKRNLFF
jgi:hypothetical protein